MSNRRLTAKQLAFIDAYMGEANGNATEAARLAGYAGDDNALGVRGHLLLRNDKVFEEITIRQREDPLVISRIERQRLLTEIATNGHEQTKDRLKAIDQLSKTGGDYVHRVEHSGPGGKPIQSQGVGVRLTKEELDKLDAHEKAALWRDMIGGGDD